MPSPASDSRDQLTCLSVKPLVWPVDPLPDFLSDHTLTGNATLERLRDVVSRWVQWLGGLWGWHDRASFALRYLAGDGRIQIYLLARPHAQSDLPVLQSEVGVLLRAHRLGDGIPLPDSEASRFFQSCVLPDVCIIEVKQYETRELWRLPANVTSNEQFLKQLPWLPPSESQEPRVVYPWWGPGGPFLLPMESLLSQEVPVTFTVYLEPTELLRHEWLWLAFMAREAQTKGEQNLRQLGAGAAMRVVDPSSSLAGRLYMANLRRLSATPFLVNAHCAAANNREDVARSVAGTVQSLIHETPFDRPQQDDERLPSGAAVKLCTQRDDRESAFEAIRQYEELSFVRPSQSNPLARLSYLADARGAATVFRLPVSIRGGVPGIRVRQLSPDFHPGVRHRVPKPGHIQLGVYTSGGIASVPVNDLTKHALITGFTGSGKTVTVLQMLHQLWTDHHIPFLVLESAKQEYRGLYGIRQFYDSLHVYTVGNDTCVPFRLNPFELLPGVRVEAHISKLQTCFEGAIPPLGPSSSVISEALLRVYKERGFNLTDVFPANGAARRSFPMLRDFVEAVEAVLQSRGYEGEVRSNLRAALVGRFMPLLIGSKGRMFGSQRSFPSPAELFSRPVVLEMNDLNLEDKALVVMFLLTLLREYREQDRSTHGKLKHITVVEEAHNVLENVGSQGTGEYATAADTRYKAVQAFCGLLTEIRAFGEGLIIADQSPVKLARDAMRNTNLQIAHQLRDGDDREAIGKAMIMEVEQRDYLGKLPPGHAAVFRTGLEKATFLCVPRYYPGAEDWERMPPEPERASWMAWRKQFRGYGYRQDLTDGQVQKRMRELVPGLSELIRPDVPFASCMYCGKPCLHRDEIFPAVGLPDSLKAAQEWFPLVDPAHRQKMGVSSDEMWQRGLEVVRCGLVRAGCPTTIDSTWCYFSHMWQSLMKQNGWGGQELDEEVYRMFLEGFAAISVNE